MPSLLRCMIVLQGYLKAVLLLLRCGTAPELYAQCYCTSNVTINMHSCGYTCTHNHAHTYVMRLCEYVYIYTERARERERERERPMGGFVGRIPQRKLGGPGLVISRVLRAPAMITNIITLPTIPLTTADDLQAVYHLPKQEPILQGPHCSNIMAPYS